MVYGSSPSGNLVGNCGFKVTTAPREVRGQLTFRMASFPGGGYLCRGSRRMQPQTQGPHDLEHRGKLRVAVRR